MYCRICPPLVHVALITVIPVSKIQIMRYNNLKAHPLLFPPLGILCQIEGCNELLFLLLVWLETGVPAIAITEPAMDLHGMQRGSLPDHGFTMGYRKISASSPGPLLGLSFFFRERTSHTLPLYSSTGHSPFGSSSHWNSNMSSTAAETCSAAATCQPRHIVAVIKMFPGTAE